jgi:hypothetical protein
MPPPTNASPVRLHARAVEVDLLTAILAISQAPSSSTKRTSQQNVRRSAEMAGLSQPQILISSAVSAMLTAKLVLESSTIVCHVIKARRRSF